MMNHNYIMFARRNGRHHLETGWAFNDEEILYFENEIVQRGDSVISGLTNIPIALYDRSYKYCDRLIDKLNRGKKVDVKNELERFKSHLKL